MGSTDYVDWITEVMGGFAVPAFLKKYRKGKKYLFLGADFSKDTERMVANELTLDLDGGYYVKEPPLSKKEEKFLKRHNLTHIPISLEERFNMDNEKICSFCGRKQSEVEKMFSTEKSTICSECVKTCKVLQKANYLQEKKKLWDILTNI